MSTKPLKLHRAQVLGPVLSPAGIAFQMQPFAGPAADPSPLHNLVKAEVWGLFVCGFQVGPSVIALFQLFRPPSLSSVSL